MTTAVRPGSAKYLIRQKATRTTLNSDLMAHSFDTKYDPTLKQKHRNELLYQKVRQDCEKKRDEITKKEAKYRQARGILSHE